MKRVTKKVLQVWIAFAALAGTAYFVFEMFGRLSIGRWVSGRRSELWNVASALDAYRSEHGVYPEGELLSVTARSKGIKLPKGGDRLRGVPQGLGDFVGDFAAQTDSRGIPLAYCHDEGGFIIFSMGPDGDYDITDPAKVYNSADSGVEARLQASPLTYDPRNGARSSGDVWMVKD